MSVDLSVCLFVCLSVCLTDYLFVCLSVCLTDYQSIRPSVCLPPACLSICLPPAAAFHPYCPQGFGNNFRRKYTQSRVICQSVVVTVASHVCRLRVFAHVGFHECGPELRQEPAQLRVLRNSPRAMPLFGFPIIVMTALCAS